jgi:hypothetical protein
MLREKESTHVASLRTLIAGLGGMAGARGTRTGTKAADCADMRHNTTISGAISDIFMWAAFEVCCQEGAEEEKRN